MADETTPPVPADEPDGDSNSTDELEIQGTGRWETEPLSDNFTHLKKKNQRAFLAAYIECGNKGFAAKRAKISRGMHAFWMKHDAEYAEAFALADEIACDKLEHEAQRRATEGVLERSYDKDGNVARERLVYSDTLLIFLLKGRRPEKFKDRNETTHKGSIRAMAAPPWMAYLTDEELERLSVQSEELRKLAEARMNPETKALPEKSE